MKPDLTRYDAVTFDFYGTIVNWEPEVAKFLRAWLRERGERLSDGELLGLYDELRQPLQNERPALRYREVLGRTLFAMSEALAHPLPADVRTTFEGIAVTHEPFPDSLASLAALKQRGLLLGALSNVDDADFSSILSRLGISLDVRITAERVGAYKPDKAHFRAALADLRALGIDSSRVLHVAQSRRADIVPANELGLTCVWVNRPGHVFGRHGSGAEAARPDYTVNALSELLDR